MLLYLTDLYYPANGRDYFKEDLFLTERLKEHFTILIGHPQQAIDLIGKADLIVFRNTGPVIAYQDYFDRFLNEVEKKRVTTFNSFDGKADIRGKQYLPDLTQAGFPVIPTIENLTDIGQLGDQEKYVIKLKNGADSIGMEIRTKEELPQADLNGKIIQPFVHLKYEVSFYYLNDQFQYALYAPDKHKRWELTEYRPSPEDIAFADRFINWNNIAHGITRVDACRMPDGSLLLMELEDLNPFLSIDLLPKEKQDQFITNWINILKTLYP